MANYYPDGYCLTDDGILLADGQYERCDLCDDPIVAEFEEILVEIGTEVFHVECSEMYPESN